MNIGTEQEISIFSVEQRREGEGDACGPTYFHTPFNKGGRRFLAAMMNRTYKTRWVLTRCSKEFFPSPLEGRLKV